MEIRGRHWTVAAVAAAGLHLAVAAWVFRSDSPPAASFGGGGSVEVALAPSSGPSAVEAPTGPRQDAAEAVPAPTVAPSAAPVETPVAPKPEAVERLVAQSVPEAAVPPDPVTEPSVAEAVQAVTPETDPVPLPEALPTPVPEIVTVEARDAVVPPTPQPRAPKPTVARAAPAPTPPEPVRAAEAPPPAGTVSASSETEGRQGSHAAGGQPSPDANGVATARDAMAPGGSADYMSRLRAWLERHKEYPNRARQRRVQGTALLVFVMDRNGNVLSHRLERSSGDRTLDHAVEEMIERAQPLPRMPESFQEARLEIRVPVQFLLR